MIKAKTGFWYGTLVLAYMLYSSNTVMYLRSSLSICEELLPAQKRDRAILDDNHLKDIY